MPSPFPGMNPYIEPEAVWHDFHERWIPLAAELLGAQVLPRYFVKIDQHISIHELDETGRRLAGRGDVLVVEGAVSEGPHEDVQTMEAPVLVSESVLDIHHESFLEVYDRESRELVTVVELLSPANKRPGPDRNQYLAKRYRILSSSASLVEIDLLRGFPRMPWNDLPACDYCVVVSRPQSRPQAGVWPIQLADRLPRIPVPLHPGHADAVLDLQECLNRIYDVAGYQYYIYDAPPDPPLTSDQTQWVKQIIQSGHE